MRPSVAVVIALCLISSDAQDKPASQQLNCKAHFAVFQMTPHVPGGLAPGMSKEEGNWYTKNKKKYPTVCLDSQKPDYFVVWSSRFLSGGAPEPVINFGSMIGNAGGASISGSGTSISTPVESEYVYLSIFRVDDVQRAQQDKSFQPRPVYYTQHESWWTYRKSHHKAMQDALTYLAEAAER